MLCLGYFADGTPVIGLPGCVMYARATIFDLLLPKLAAGVRIERKDIVKLGHGGLCLGCSECHYPVCPFGSRARKIYRKRGSTYAGWAWKNY